MLRTIVKYIPIVETSENLGEKLNYSKTEIDELSLFVTAKLIFWHIKCIIRSGFFFMFFSY